MVRLFIWLTEYNVLCVYIYIYYCEKDDKPSTTKPPTTRLPTTQPTPCKLFTN